MSIVTTNSLEDKVILEKLKIRLSLDFTPKIVIILLSKHLPVNNANQEKGLCKLSIAKNAIKAI